MAHAPHRDRAQLIISGLLIALGLFMFYQAQLIVADGGYSAIGPRFSPMLVAGVLLLIGVLLLRQALTGGWRNMEGAVPQPSRSSRRRSCGSRGGLALNMAVIGFIGFTIASALLYVVVARGFGSRRLGRDSSIGLVLAPRGVPTSSPACSGWRARLSPPASSRRGRRWKDSEELIEGFAVALTSTNLMWAFSAARSAPRSACCPAWPGGDHRAAAAAHHQLDADVGADHVLRRLLRRDVRRLDHVDPAEHAGRNRRRSPPARRQRDGQAGPRRSGAGHCGDRLVRRRHDRHGSCVALRALCRRMGLPFGPPESSR